MGTRSTTKIYEDGKLLLALYKQWDGHTDSWGKELKDFIKSKKFVNGYSTNEKHTSFNGVGCFALQLVTKFKDGVGDLYATTEEDEQEYNYVLEFSISNEELTLNIKCLEDDSYTEEIKLN